MRYGAFSMASIYEWTERLLENLVARSWQDSKLGYVRSLKSVLF